MMLHYIPEARAVNMKIEFKIIFEFMRGLGFDF